MVLEAASGLPAQPWVWTVVLCVGFAAIVGLARAGVSAAVTVNYTVDGTALLGTDYTGISATGTDRKSGV